MSRGIGMALVRRSVEAARGAGPPAGAAGRRRAVLRPRRLPARARRAGLRCPDRSIPARLLVLELEPGVFEGVKGPVRRAAGLTANAGRHPARSGRRTTSGSRVPTPAALARGALRRATPPAGSPAAGPARRSRGTPASTPTPRTTDDVGAAHARCSRCRRSASRTPASRMVGMRGVSPALLGDAADGAAGRSAQRREAARWWRSPPGTRAGSAGRR